MYYCFERASYRQKEIKAMIVHSEKMNASYVHSRKSVYNKKYKQLNKSMKNAINTKKKRVFVYSE